MAARTAVKGRATAPTPAEQRKLVDEFRRSPGAQIVDPWDPNDPTVRMRPKDDLYTQFADAQSTSTKDRVYAQIEARGGDSVEARTVVAARTPGGARRLDFSSPEGTPSHRISYTRDGNPRVEPSSGTGEGDRRGTAAASWPEQKESLKAYATRLAADNKRQAEARLDRVQRDADARVDEAQQAALDGATQAVGEATERGYRLGVESSAAVEEYATDVAKRIDSLTDGMDALKKAGDELPGASSEARIHLLQELQGNRELQEMVKAGLMQWSDLIVKNPAPGTDNYVSNPDGDDPKYVIDSSKLTGLRRKLADYGTKQAGDLRNVQQAIARRRTTPGAVPSAGDAIFPGVKVWTPAAWAAAPMPGA